MRGLEGVRAGCAQFNACAATGIVGGDRLLGIRVKAVAVGDNSGTVVDHLDLDGVTESNDGPNGPVFYSESVGFGLCRCSAKAAKRNGCKYNEIFHLISPSDLLSLYIRVD